MTEHRSAHVGGEERLRVVAARPGSLRRPRRPPRLERDRRPVRPTPAGRPAPGRPLAAGAGRDLRPQRRRDRRARARSTPSPAGVHRPGAGPGARARRSAHRGVARGRLRHAGRPTRAPPARSARPDRRARRRCRRPRRDARQARTAVHHAHRAGRDRQDPARPRGRPPGGADVRRRRGLGGARGRDDARRPSPTWSAARSTSAAPPTTLSARSSTISRDRDVLLVLDNCEHLVDACADLVAALLAGTSGLRVLSTSRERLDVGGETIWPVLPARGPSRRLPAGAARLVRGEQPVPAPRAPARPHVPGGAGRARVPSWRCADASTGCRSRSSWQRPGPRR